MGETRKNELWIDAGNNFLYFETEKRTVSEAFEEFCEKLRSVGCVTDNFGERCDFELRRWLDDGDYVVLDRKMNENWDGKYGRRFS